MTSETETGSARRKSTSAPLCVHHWVIDSADGAESKGSCKHCGEQRGFANSLESEGWGAIREDRAGSTSTSLASIVRAKPERTADLADEV
jgi:hypothetical protein